MRTSTINHISRLLNIINETSALHPWKFVGTKSVVRLSHASRIIRVPPVMASLIHNWKYFQRGPPSKINTNANISFEYTGLLNYQLRWKIYWIRTSSKAQNWRGWIMYLGRELQLIFQGSRADCYFRNAPPWLSRSILTVIAADVTNKIVWACRTSWCP